MRFTCDRCHHQHDIADDKVRGKVVKVRCKACGQTLTLRGTPDALKSVPEPSSDSQKTSQMTLEEVNRAIDAVSATEELAWYAMLGGKQKGPFSERELRRLADAGELKARTYLWRDGMPDWKRAKDIPGLEKVIATVAAPPQSLPPLPPLDPRAPAEMEASAAPTNPHATAPEELAMTMLEAVPAVDSAHLDVVLEVAEKTLSRDGPPVPLEAPVEDAAPTITSGVEKPRGNSVVTEPSARDPFAAIPNAPHFSEPEPGETTGAIIRAAGARKNNLWKAGLVIGGVLAVIGGVLVSFADNPMVASTLFGEPEAEKAVGGTGKLSALDALMHRKEHGHASAAVARAAPSQTMPAAATAAPPVDTEGALVKKEAAHTKTLTAEEKAQLALIAGDEKAIGFRGPRSAEEHKDIDKAEGGLSPQVISQKVRDNQPAFGACLNDALRRKPDFKAGKVRMVTTISPSGIVTAAVISEPADMNDSDFGQCVRKATKRIVFPSFPGDAFDVEIPLVLGVGG